MDGSRLWPSHDNQRDGLTCITTKAAIWHSQRPLALEMVVQGLCIQACVGSKPRTPAGPLPCALPGHVRQKPEWKRDKCFRATWCSSRNNALGGRVSASC